MKLIIPNWATYQHYANRNPPWIKLHKKLLDNFTFHGLPVASRALAPMLWLLASESDMGEIDKDPEEIAFRLRMSASELLAALKPLIDKGFIEDASTMLEPCKQDAILEREKSREETEPEEKKKPAGKKLKHANGTTSIPEEAVALSSKIKSFWRREDRDGRKIAFSQDLLVVRLAEINRLFPQFTWDILEQAGHSYLDTTSNFTKQAQSFYTLTPDKFHNHKPPFQEYAEAALAKSLRSQESAHAV